MARARTRAGRPAVVVRRRPRQTAAGARGALSWPNDAESRRARHTNIPGLIDAHDHLAAHGYGLATRFGLDEPASTATCARRAFLEDTLGWVHDRARRRRPRRGLRWPIEGGLIPAAPGARHPDRVADGRHRRSREPVRHTCCASTIRSSEQRGQRPDGRARVVGARWSAPAPM